MQSSTLRGLIVPVLVVVAGVPLCMSMDAAAAQPGPTAGPPPGARAPGFLAAPPPPLFFREPWHRNPGDHGQIPVVPANVSNPDLQLQVYGLDAKGLTISGMAGNPNNLVNLWTGLSTEPIAVTLRDRQNYVDLTGRAKIRWTVRTSGFHVVRPVVRLADGTLLVGDHTDASTTLFNTTEFAIADIRWIRLDPQRVVTIGTYGPYGQAASWYEHPDLSKVDAVGFADLLPGSGHGSGGWINVADFQVYGKPVKR
jgi:hypothetical protein